MLIDFHIGPGLAIVFVFMGILIDSIVFGEETFPPTGGLEEYENIK